MGSNTSAVPEPSSSLVLARPTPAERSATWAATHPQWGAALDLETYLRREAFLTTVPMSRNGGMTQWILTTADGNPDSRPVLSSCESIRKRCLVATPPPSPGPDAEWHIREAVAHGIASVFTEPQHRGNGYASKMMAKLGPHLGTWQGKALRGDGGDDDIGRVTEKTESEGQNEETANGHNHKPQTPPPRTTVAASGSPGGGTGDGHRPVAFSILFSDIGKTFYAKNGWPPFESSHLSFRPSPTATSELPGAPDNAAALNLRPISYHDLPELCTIDEQLLRRRLARPSSSSGSHGNGNGNAAAPPAKPRVALVPDLDAILWHLLREDFMTSEIFGKTPSIRGALFQDTDLSPATATSNSSSSPSPSLPARIWAVWSRGYYGGLKAPEVGNTMHILRLVVEHRDGEDGVTDEYLSRAVGAILSKAREEAAEWKVNDVEMWNPSEKLRRAIGGAGVPCEFVSREKDSIASLMWYGDGDVEWVANEKFGWC